MIPYLHSVEVMSIMNTFFEKFKQLLETENKQKTVEYALELIQNRKVDVVRLYEEILTPALNQMQCKLEEKHLCIWKEHIQTAIVRTIVECCYPYVLYHRDQLNIGGQGRAVILCPPEEYHDLGARMVSDFFVLCGCESIFVGSNTPYTDFYNAVDTINPDIIAISVSNYYNLVVTKKIITDLKNKIKSPVKIITGGNAYLNRKDNLEAVGADFFAQTFEDIQEIVLKGVRS